MPKISASAGPTDEHAEGYFSPGRSHHSPNVRAPKEEKETPVVRTVPGRKRGLK